MRLDGHAYSPAVLQMIVSAGGRLSFADAAFALSLSGLSISARHVQELTGVIGQELAARRDAQAVKRRRRQLCPQVTPPPDVVAVEVDGGRLRTRAPGCGPGVHQAETKEDKLACLITLKSHESADDPQPEPPLSFRQPRRIQRLVRRMHGLARGEMTDEEPLEEASDPSSKEASDLSSKEASDPSSEEAAPGSPEAEPWAPRRLVRTCVASMQASRAFGPLMAAEAQTRNFYAAGRRAFVADGQAYNWTIHRGYFPDFVPIVDFLHVICYLFTAAQVVADEDSTRWAQYEAWLRHCWQGQVSEVIRELEQWQGTMGRPPPDETLAATDARRVVAEALSYLSHNVERMQYPKYRREGLPTTSSLVESLVGEFGARVKGKGTFWNRPEGVEGILQVRAAYLSEDGRLDRYFASRPGSPYRRRRAA